MPSQDNPLILPVAVACDHGGVALKAALIEELQGLGCEVLDLGTNGPDSVDYPDFGYALARAIRDGQAGRGVLICGSGIGISIAANRFPEIRAALVHDVTCARLSREHNDANVIVFGGRMIGSDLCEECVDTLIGTEFEGGRHQRRVDKLSNPPL